MDTQKVIQVLDQTLKSSAFVVKNTKSPIHLEIFNKQIELFDQIKILLMENPDKHEVLRLGIILIQLHYMIENDFDGDEDISILH